MKSRDSAQLNGKYRTPAELNDCDPIILVGDLWDYQKKNVMGKTLDDKLPAIPCGLVAKSVFNDTYKLIGPDGKQVTIDKTNIAWSSDIEYKFHNIREAPNG